MDRESSVFDISIRFKCRQSFLDVSVRDSNKELISLYWRVILTVEYIQISNQNELREFRCAARGKFMSQNF